MLEKLDALIADVEQTMESAKSDDEYAPLYDAWVSLGRARSHLALYRVPKRPT